MSIDIACKDTICALSSAHGRAALSVIRASGPKSKIILENVFRKHRGELTPFLAMHGEIKSDNDIIDDVVAILFNGKKSFTGEDSFEIYCHGNPIIVEKILKLLCEQGARLALPGEFTLRAVLNGKIDLAQAESVADLIHAQSDAAAKVAIKGVKAGLKEKTHRAREIMVSLLAEIEARMDFPDEDLGSYDKIHLLDNLSDAISDLERLLSHAPYGLKLHQGARIVICGLPNAGKSTLLNALSGEEKAIVHEKAGTTRDVIEASMVLNDIPVTLVDVAGIRSPDVADDIEKIGIERAIKELKKAEIVLWLADGTLDNPFDCNIISDHLKDITVPVIRVVNKNELFSADKHPGVLSISAKLAHGIRELKDTLKKHLGASLETEEIFITRARQRDEIIAALEAFKEAKRAFSNGFIDEVVASELRNAGSAFDRLFGTETSEDVLDKIFSEFCIGK